MLEAMKSLREEFQSLKKTPKEVAVDQTSTSASKLGTSKQTENLDPTPPLRTQPSSHPDEAMEGDLYGPPLPPRLGDITLCMNLTRDISRINIQVSQRNLLGWSRLDPKNMQIKESTRLGPGTYLSHHLQRKISPLYPYKGLPTMVRITTQIYPNNPNRCVRPEPKNIRTNANTRFGPNIFPSRHPQWRISPLLTRKGLVSPLSLLKTNLNTIQTHFFIGK